MVALVLAFLQPPVSLVLSTPQTTYTIGKPIFVRVEATNQADRPIVLSLPRDGTDRGMRAPFMELQMRTSRGKWVRAFPPGLSGCGNVNGPEPGDYFTLQPKARRVVVEGPNEPASEALAKPGTYRLRYMIDTRPEVRRWEGGLEYPFAGAPRRVAPFVLAAHAAAPKGVFFSNELTVHIVPRRS